MSVISVIRTPSRAISELLRPRPNPSYLAWVETLARGDQFTSAICITELFKGA